MSHSVISKIKNFSFHIFLTVALMFIGCLPVPTSSSLASSLHPPDPKVLKPHRTVSMKAVSGLRMIIQRMSSDHNGAGHFHYKPVRLHDSKDIRPLPPPLLKTTPPVIYPGTKTGVVGATPRPCKK